MDRQIPDAPLSADNYSLITRTSLISPPCSCSSPHAVQGLLGNGKQVWLEIALFSSGVCLDDLGAICGQSALSAEEELKTDRLTMG